jgi:cell wall-associated NlpC family hydrolase
MTESEYHLRQAIIAEAVDWLKTPYHHAARQKGEGVDCALFLAEVYHRVGAIPEILPAQYPPDWHHHQNEEKYLGWVLQFAAKIDGPPLPGDAALYKFGNCTAHGGIIIEWPTIVHAYLPAKMVTFDDGEANAALRSRFAGFYRLRDLL